MQPELKKIFDDQKVVAMPGVQPESFINNDAADMLQQAVDRLRSGEYVGVAYVALYSDGGCTYDWDVPTRMGNSVFVGASRLQHALLVSGTKWEI